MPKSWIDRVIVLSIVGLVAWGIVVLPFLYGQGANQTAQQCSEKENKNYGFWEKTRCDPIAYFTLWLVGFTGVLAAVSIFQGVILIRADTTARITAEAAKINAEAAKKSAEVAERAFSHSRQPYIGFRRGALQNTGIGELPELEVIAINIGRGTAYAVKAVTRLEVIPIEQLTTPFKIPYEGAGDIILAKDATLPTDIIANRPLTASDIDNINAQRAAICAYGYVIFQNEESKEDTRLFCYVAKGTDIAGIVPIFCDCKIEIERPETEKIDQGDP